MPIFPPVVLLTADSELAALAKAAIWEDGCPVQHLTWPDQLDAVAQAPQMLLRGHDIGSDLADAVRHVWPACVT
ncbi:MAG: hypothetical protein LBD90_02935, partial [Bifidobacteriaceae bacterium]|nr:hypothetical protein [Bifidobacteriaceae bacterium]